MDDNYNERRELEDWDAGSEERDQWEDHREWVREQNADTLRRDWPVVRKAA